MEEREREREGRRMTIIENLWCHGWQGASTSQLLVISHRRWQRVDASSIGGIVGGKENEK